MDKNIDDKLDHLLLLETERKCLLDLLRLWRHAEKVGFKSVDIEVFTFRSRFVSRAERKAQGWPIFEWSCDTHFNCVRLKNGDLKEIPLYQRPKP